MTEQSTNPIPSISTSQKNRPLKSTDVEMYLTDHVPPLRDTLEAYQSALLQSDPFFGSMLLFMTKKKVVNTPSFTMAVGYDPTRNEYYLMWNPLFVQGLERFRGGSALVAECLIHELRHIYFNHCTENSIVHVAIEELFPDESIIVEDAEDAKEKIAAAMNIKQMFYLQNVAMDLQINRDLNSITAVSGCVAGKGYLTNPKFGIHLHFNEDEDKWEHVLFQDLLAKNPKLSAFYAALDSFPAEDTWINYLDKLLDHPDCKGKCFNPGDIDLVFQSLNDPNARKRLPSWLRRVFDMANTISGGKPWGDHSKNDSAHLGAIVSDKQVIDWRAIVQNYAKSVISINRSSTMKKLNRRLPYLFPGGKLSEQSKILICVDQSGSMSDNAIQQIFGEIKKLSDAKMCAFDIVFNDTSFNKDQILKFNAASSRNFGTKDCVRLKGGGTDFTEVISFYEKESNYDGMLLLTDGYCPAPNCSFRRSKRVCWIVTEKNAGQSFVKDNDIYVLAEFRA